jgi:hypothetical protein
LQNQIPTEERNSPLCVVGTFLDVQYSQYVARKTYPRGIRAADCRRRFEGRKRCDHECADRAARNHGGRPSNAGVAHFSFRREWEFSPARIGALVVKSEIEVPVRFKLTD